MSLVLKRLALAVLTLWFVSVLVFAGTELLPGDVAAAILGQSATPEALRQLRHDLGLDQSALHRYVAWFGGLLHGDLGRSLANGEAVGNLLWPRFWNTMALAAYAAGVSVPLAVGLGILSAIRRGGVLDRLANIVTLTTISLPEYFLGLLLILLLAVQWAVFPSLADVHEGMGIGEWFAATTLPMATLVLVTAAHMLRMTRTAVLAVMESPFIETAYLKGLSTGRIVWKHALPNAAAPIVNAVAFNIAYLVTGVVLVEVIFNYNGLGRFMVDAVAKRDMPMVQACAMVFGLAYVLLNTGADLAAILLNPRLRHPR